MTPTPDEIERVVAVALWRAEVTDAGAPNSAIAGRTARAFMDSSPELQAKWLKLARAACRAMRDAGVA